MCLTRRHFLEGVAAAGGVGLLAACDQNQAIQRSQLILVPDDWMSSLAQGTWQATLRSGRLSSDARAKATITRVGSRIADKLGRSDVDWEFALLENPVPNAFVLPGGKVVFHTGILKMMDNEAQLAAVMGHEMGHVVARHAAERLSQELAKVAALWLLSWFLAERVDRRAAWAIHAAFGAGVTFGILLPYSRQHEYEADHLGVEVMAEAGYDPKEAIAFWRNMMSRARFQPYEFLSTHPSSANRIAAIEEQLPQVLPVYDRARRA
ncbi:MAG: M48 family metalloprotease [Azospirillum sp.]|nr:M48 family metalloprotease [Azospirillum sp.]